MIIAASMGLLMIVVGTSTDLVTSILSTGSIEVSQKNVVNYDGKSYIVMTIKNTGTSTITNAEVRVQVSDILSKPVFFDENIEEGNSSRVNEILKDENDNIIITQTGERILVTLNATTTDGSKINIDPIKLRVK